MALNTYLENETRWILFTGIRWDEQASRETETYYSPRRDVYAPEHVRIHPLLHLSEEDVWQIIRQNKIPYVPLYKQGFRSLGAASSTQKTGTLPAWRQNLNKTNERQGRQQDKEQIMHRLRDLGYM